MRLYNQYSPFQSLHRLVKVAGLYQQYTETQTHSMSVCKRWDEKRRDKEVEDNEVQNKCFLSEKTYISSV